jgi:copper(I)-binding protein
MRVVVLLLGGCIVGTACGQQAPPAVTDATAIIVAGGTAAAVAMTITAEDDNELVGASVGELVGGPVTLINPDGEADPGHVGHLDPGGNISPAGHSHGVRLPAGVATQLGGDGPQITIGRLVASIAPGDEFEIVLSFSKSADVTVTVSVVGRSASPP